MPRIIKRMLLSTLLLVPFAAMSAEPWLAPIHSYINLSSSNTNVDNGSPIVLSESGNPIGNVQENENFVVKVLPTASGIQTVEVSIDGVTYFPATLQNGSYQYDFGLLSINNYTLNLRIDGVEQPSVDFIVTEQVIIPERVSAGYAPNEVGVNQPFEMRWESVEGAEHYTVLVQDGGSGGAVLQRIENLTDTDVEITHNTIQVIIVRVQACNSAGCSAAWGTRIINVLGNVPSVPVNVEVPTEAFLDEEFNVTWAAVSGASEYKVYVNGGRKVTTSALTASITVTKEGQANIGVAACNSNGCSSPSTGQSVLVALDPNTPIANPDTATLQVLSSQTISVVDNDVDPLGTLLRVTEISQQPSLGTASISGDGASIVYTNTTGACGGVEQFSDSLQYKVENANGLVSKSATVEITMNCTATGNWVALPVPFNVLPPQYTLHVGKQDYYLAADATSWIMVRDVPIGLYGDYSFIRIYKSGDSWLSTESTYTEFSANAIAAIPQGLLQVANLGTDDYYSANLDIGLGQQPIAVEDNGAYTLNNPVFVNVVRNDVAPAPQHLRVTSIVRPPMFGTATIGVHQQGIVYTADPDSCLQDSLIYEVTNNNRQTSIAEVTLQCVASSGQAPTAIDDVIYYLVNQSASSDIVANDIFPSSLDIEVAITSAPGHGSAILEGTTLQFTPSLDTCTNDTIGYSLTNNNGTSNGEIELKCLETHWDNATVSINQPATIKWQQLNATYCSLSYDGSQYYSMQGQQTFTFFVPGTYYWQCFNVNDNAVTQPYPITVNKLPAPGNLVEQ